MALKELALVGGYLLLSPSHPLLLKSKAELWLSRSDLVLAQNHGPSEVLLSYKSEGLLQVAGLASSQESFRSLLVLTDQNYRAFKRCHRWFDFDSRTSGFVLRSDAFSKNTLKADFKKLKPCDFSHLSLKEEDLPAWTSHFVDLENKLKSSGFQFKQPSWKNGRRQLELFAPDTEKPQIEKLLSPFSAFYDLHFKVGSLPGQTVLFELTVFEMSRSEAQSLGLKIPTALEAQASTSWPLQIKAHESFLTVLAEMSEQGGAGKILARPQLRTQPGQEARFHSGGEIPIQQKSNFSSHTNWKAYGLFLSLLPDARIQGGAREISLHLKLEVSEPDFSTAVDGLPGMKVRRLESRFDLRTEETTILGTMIQSRSGLQRDGVWSLSQLPLLGLLFGGEKRQEQASELWFALKASWRDIPTQDFFAAKEAP